MFIILSGSSGVGKNTIIGEIEKKYPQFKLMPTYTTRKKRENEVNGYPFYFISKEEFQDKIKQGELIEYEYIHNNFYGSSYKIFNEFIKNNVILIKDIGIEGAQNISIKLSKETDVLKIFLTTKNKRVLKNRLKFRGEKQIKLRLKRFKKEQKERNKFDYLILNNSIESTTKIITTIYDIPLEDFIPTKEVKRINLKKIKKLCEKLLKGKILKPIHVSLNDDKIYITKCHEKFIAGLLCNKSVCKLIKLEKIESNLSVEQLMEWKTLIRESMNRGDN